MSGSGLGALVIDAEPSDHEGKLALVRKLLFAIDKKDEHAALAALEDLIDECGHETDVDDDGED